MKKIASLVFAALLFFGAFFFVPQTARAETFDQSTIYEPYYILVNAADPTVSYRGIEKEADKQVFPASTTKILTCILALERGNLDDMVSVSAKAVDFGRGNSLMGLLEGDQYSLRDLLYGMMLPSGNDAAIAIAEHIAGSTDAFAQMMNEKAQAIGMTHSHFVTVHGKQNDNHYVTVRDMAILTAYALNTSPKKDDFRKIVGTATYTAESGPRAIELVNSNRMLVDTPPTEDFPNPISCLYADAIGVKTGDTTAAGKCLVAAAERDGVTMIAVLYGGTLDDPDYNPGWNDARKDRFNVKRFQDAAALFDYAFSDMLRTVTVSDLISQSNMPVEFEVQISNASQDDSQGGVLKAKADLSPDLTLTLMQPDPTATTKDFKITVTPTFSNQYAPISEGSQVGTVIYSYNGKTIAQAPLIAERSVKEGASMTEISTNSEQQSAQNAPVSLIGSANGGSGEQGGGCSSSLPGWFWIVLIALVVLLIGVIVLFMLYVRAERKRQAAARRRAARRRAMQNAGYTDRI